MWSARRPGIADTYAMTMQDIPLYDRPAFRRAAGSTLRPGGPELTRRALKLGEEFCGLRPGGRVLDAGCGPGTTLELCAALGFVPMGVDLRPDSAETTQGAPFPILRADIRRLPLADACCDAVVCECVLSLLPDPETALAEACRVLRRGGALLLTDLYLRPAYGSEGQGNPLCSQKISLSFRDASPFPESAPPKQSCLDGAASWPTLHERLLRQGFTVHVMEDHSRALAELAARCIFQGQSLSDWGLPCRGGSVRRFGYLLAVASKAAA